MNIPFIKIFISVFFVLLIFQSCTETAAISKDEFDSITWKNDKNACQNKRKELMEQFKNIQSRIIGVSEPELRKLLGAPDNIELYRKHQKFYIYYIESASGCENGKERAERIYVRLNAINNVNEITQKNS